MKERKHEALFFNLSGEGWTNNAIHLYCHMLMFVPFQYLHVYLILLLRCTLKLCLRHAREEWF